MAIILLDEFVVMDHLMRHGGRIERLDRFSRRLPLLTDSRKHFPIPNSNCFPYREYQYREFSKNDHDVSAAL
jgi:hypothetical protein